LPRLPDRPLFVRHAANLWQVKAAIQQRLTIVSGQAADPVQVIATLPLPGCAYPRALRDRCVNPAADSGHGAAKQLDYSRCKLGVRVARSGMITSCPLLPAQPHDITLLDDLVAGFAGVVPADTGCIDAVRQALLAARQGVLVITPPRQGMVTQHSPTRWQACQRIRKWGETVGVQLTERFAIARMRVRDLWHYQHRLLRKVLAHTVVVFLNLR
jgi:hypothetical protein